eukprot:1723936-Pyramimonas_sp.AAC.1
MGESRGRENLISGAKAPRTPEVRTAPRDTCRTPGKEGNLFGGPRLWQEPGMHAVLARSIATARSSRCQS